MHKKIQVVLIGGGMTFKTQAEYYKDLKAKKVSLVRKNKWNYEYLDQALGKKYEVIRPWMPLADNAEYLAWQIYFEKYLKLLDKNYILIGFSLGAVFLVKFLADKKITKKPVKVLLVAAPFDGEGSIEKICGGFKLKKDFSLLEKNCQDIVMYFSQDDLVVPVLQAEKYRKKLSQSQIRILKNKNGHFQCSTFSELIKEIRG